MSAEYSLEEVRENLCAVERVRNNIHSTYKSLPEDWHDWALEQVAELTCAVNLRNALTAYANRIEADEGAVPAAWRSRDASGLRWIYGPRDDDDKLKPFDDAELLFTHPPAQAAQVADGATEVIRRSLGSDGHAVSLVFRSQETADHFHAHMDEAMKVAQNATAEPVVQSVDVDGIRFIADFLRTLSPDGEKWQSSNKSNPAVIDIRKLADKLTAASKPGESHS